MKTDKQIKDISDRLNAISNNDNGRNNHNDDTFRIDKYDDEYYLDQNRDPPRFYIYRQARAEKWQATGPHEPSDYDRAITQDELDYRLKERLRIPPEQRYQHEKEYYYFHELYIEGGKECNPLYEGCTTKCRFHSETGRIEDMEVIEKHSKLVESMRRDNEIVEPPSEAELQRLAKAYVFDLM